MNLCSPPSSMCHLARLYSEQQLMEFTNYGKKFYEKLLMYKLIWNARFQNCMFFFHFEALVRLYSRRKLMVREANQFLTLILTLKLGISLIIEVMLVSGLFRFY